jgi:hypothetical protein
VCQVCARPLRGGRADRRYCDAACRQKHYRQRKAAPLVVVDRPTGQQRPEILLTQLAYRLDVATDRAKRERRDTVQLHLNLTLADARIVVDALRDMGKPPWSRPAGASPAPASPKRRTRGSKPFTVVPT